MITVESVEVTLQPWDVMAVREGSAQEVLTELLTTVALTNVVERISHHAPALVDLVSADVTEWLAKWIQRLVERVAEIIKGLVGPASLAIPIGSGLTVTLNF